jgi:OmpA-OmpF porin, OOP family
MSKQPCWPGFWLGLISLGLIGLLAIYTGPQGKNGIQADLKAKVEKALSAQGLTSVGVEMKGQRAVLTGAVPTEDGKALAAKTALGAAGSGGVFAGGVTKVDASALTIGAVQAYEWAAVRDGDGLRLTGFVPSEEARKQINDAARKAFPKGQIVDEMTLRPGAPGGAAWVGMASASIGRIAQLTGGAAKMTDSTLSISGEAPKAVVDQMTAAYAKPPEPFKAQLNLNTPGGDVAIPEIAGINLENARSGDCNEAFDAVMKSNTINFRSGSASIDPSSREVLQKVAQIARRCSKYRVTVKGHTDNQGSDGRNQILSRARAIAVQDYLIARGAPRRQVSAQGLGSSQPLADNATPEGRAKNRRIEFDVRA